MAHLFKQMYCDEVDYERMNNIQIIDLVFTEFLHKKICELSERRNYIVSKMNDLSLTTQREIKQSEKRWLEYGYEALSEIDCENIWLGILECCRILRLPNPTVAQRRYFESLFILSGEIWSGMYSDTARTTVLNTC